MDMYGGGEGNRTPVRKSIYRGLFHHSRYFKFPSVRRLTTGFKPR